MHTTFSHAQRRWLSLPRVKEKQFLVNFPSIFFHSTRLLMKDPRLVWRAHTLAHAHASHINGWLTDWLTDGVRLEHLLPADSSALTNRMIRSFIIHSSPTSLSFFSPSSHHIPSSPFNHLYLVARVCVFFFSCACARVSSRGWRTAFSSIVSRTKDIRKPNWVWPSFDYSSPARLNPGSEHAHDHSHSPHIAALQPPHTPGATCI